MTYAFLEHAISLQKSPKLSLMSDSFLFKKNLKS